MLVGAELCSSPQQIPLPFIFIPHIWFKPNAALLGNQLLEVNTHTKTGLMMRKREDGPALESIFNESSSSSSHVFFCAVIMRNGWTRVYKGWTKGRTGS